MKDDKKNNNNNRQNYISIYFIIKSLTFLFSLPSLGMYKRESTCFGFLSFLFLILSNPTCVCLFFYFYFKVSCSLILLLLIRLIFLNIIIFNSLIEVGFQ
jgi:hypothetical protein